MNNSEIGKKYGRLIVISLDHIDKRWSKFWLCKCSCGNTKVINQGALRSGATRSCGCLRNERASETNRIELKGKQFGQLEVLERIGSKRTSDKSTTVLWKCKCDCGNEKIVDSHSLLSKLTKSCGCLSKYKDRSEPALNNLINAYKAGAKKRKLVFEISKEKFKEITSSPCNYCGELPLKVKKTDCGGEYKYNGIDRLDSTVGYIESNVVPCCWKCNVAKTNMSVNEFKIWIRQVYNYFIGAPV